MPQLDTVTFFSQYVWLVVFFGGFYLSIVKYYLPKMGRILKVRQKKMVLADGPVGSGEVESVRSVGNTLVLQATKQARTRFVENAQSTWAWSSQVLAAAQSGHFATPNASYDTSLKTVSLQQSRIVRDMTTCVGGVVPGSEQCTGTQKVYAAHLLANLS